MRVASLAEDDGRLNERTVVHVDKRFDNNVHDVLDYGFGRERIVVFSRLRFLSQRAYVAL